MANLKKELEKERNQFAAMDSELRQTKKWLEELQYFHRQQELAQTNGVRQDLTQMQLQLNHLMHKVILSSPKRTQVNSEEESEAECCSDEDCSCCGEEDCSEEENEPE